MNELQTILDDSVQRLLTDAVTTELRIAAEEGAWPTELWAALEEQGLIRVLVSEQNGGVGGTWQDALIVLLAAGRYALPLPLAETILAGGLLDRAGLPVPDGALSIGPVRLGDELRLEDASGSARLTGRLRRIPWGSNVGHLALVASAPGGQRLVLAAAADLEARSGDNIAREPRCDITFADTPIIASAPLDDPERLWLHGALIRTAQIAGGMSMLLDETVHYVNDRVQFGRPIGKFQAIQQQLAVLAGQVAAARSAAAGACRAADGADPAFEIAIGKQRTSDMVEQATSIAHQSHGAIGFTYEHSLHYVTRRLWSWRAEFGGAAYWAERLGREVAGRGGEALWPMITAR